MDQTFAHSMLHHHISARREVAAFKIGLNDVSSMNRAGEKNLHQLVVSRKTREYFENLSASFEKYDAELDEIIVRDGFDKTYDFMNAKKVHKRFKEMFWSGFKSAVYSIDYDLLAVELLSIKSFGNGQESPTGVHSVPLKNSKESVKWSDSVGHV